VRNYVTPAHCAVCDTWKGKDNMVAQIDSDYCCADCAQQHNKPGRFEAYSSSDDLGKCLILNSLSENGCEDEYMSSEGWGYCGRFGNYLLYLDTSGFVTYDEFDTEEKAEARYMALYKDGMGADEFAAYVHDGRAGYSASLDGKHIGIYPTQRRAIAACRLECMRTGYYPDLWYVNDHGNYTFVEDWR